MNLEKKSYVKNMPSKKKSRFQCEFCNKVCLSSGSLKRHVIRKHPSSKAQETSSSDCRNKAETTKFKRFLREKYLRISSR